MVGQNESVLAASFLDKALIGGITLAMVLRAVLLIAVCFIAVKLISHLASRAVKKTKLEIGMKSFIEKIVKIALWFMAAIIVADSFGIPVASLVAVLGVAGLALSLSVQGLLTNLFSGMSVLVTKPFVVGDYVEIGATAGTVREIGLYYTALLTVDNKVIRIPNGDVASSSIVNYSQEKLRRVDLSYLVSYDSPAEEAIAALLEAAGEEPLVLADPAPAALVTAYREGSVEYTLRAWVAGGDYWPAHTSLNGHMRERFSKHGVTLSSNHLNVRLDK